MAVRDSQKADFYRGKQKTAKTSMKVAKELPDLSGIVFRKERDEDKKPQLFISTIAQAARKSQALPAEKRTIKDRMNIAAWAITWRCFKRNKPGLARLLKSDPVQEIMKTFNAEARINLDEL